jgi:hypothetical protein
LILAVFFTLIFAVMLRRKGPWVSVGIFFIVLLLATWGIGGSIRYMGPVTLGVYWLPFVLIALIFSLFLAAALPARRYERTDQGRSGEGDEKVALDAFFYMFILILAAMVLISYIFPTVVI